MSLTGLVWNELDQLVIKHGVAPTLVEKDSKGDGFAYQLHQVGIFLGQIEMHRTPLPDLPSRPNPFRGILLALRYLGCDSRDASVDYVVLSATKAGQPPQKSMVLRVNPRSYQPKDVTTGMSMLFNYLMKP